ncbi:MAG: DUF3738 domain-containing protein, partial [Sediminibacterium sp.]
YSGYGATKNMIVLGNIGLKGLLAFAYGKGSLEYLAGWGKIKLITSDTLRFSPGQNKSTQFNTNWVENHSYNYVLKVPEKDSSAKYEIMQRSLQYYFPQITVKLETEERMCYVLKCIDNSMPFKSTDTLPLSYVKNPYNLKIKNGYMTMFVEVLRWAYQKSDFTIIDETGYSGKIDINLETEVAKPEKLNTALSKYGLKLEKTKRPVTFLLIHDNEQ